MSPAIKIDNYSLLQQRLEQKVQDAPNSPALMKILRVLFSPNEAELARRLPHNLTSLRQLAKNLGIPKKDLEKTLTEMASRGLVIDLLHEGERYFTLSPVMIGFFELVFMRARPDLPMNELAHLFEQYFYENEAAFFRGFFHGRTQIGRAFVREETIPEDRYSEVMDWERASEVIETASHISVTICQCHHAAQYVGHACNKPREVCLSFNCAAETLSRNGMTRLIGKSEAREILARSKEAGLCQIGDNFRKQVNFMCNCCGCCCHGLRAIRKYEFRNALVTSNYIMEVDASKCTGCGKCVKVCPVEAIAIQKTGGKPEKGLAVRNAEVCLGCGTCISQCKTKAASMKKRAQKVIVPETVFDQRVAMAIERERLADLLFDDPERLSHRALRRVMYVLERAAPFKAAMAVKPLKSVFMQTMVAGAKFRMKGVADLFV